MKIVDFDTLLPAVKSAVHDMEVFNDILDNALMRADSEGLLDLKSAIDAIIQAGMVFVARRAICAVPTGAVDDISSFDPVEFGKLAEEIARQQVELFNAICEKKRSHVPVS